MLSARSQIFGSVAHGRQIWRKPRFFLFHEKKRQSSYLMYGLQANDNAHRVVDAMDNSTRAYIFGPAILCANVAGFELAQVFQCVPPSKGISLFAS
jgi:hypothetical protein